MLQTEYLIGENYHKMSYSIVEGKDRFILDGGEEKGSAFANFQFGTSGNPNGIMGEKSLQIENGKEKKLSTQVISFK